MRLVCESETGHGKVRGEGREKVGRLRIRGAACKTCRSERDGREIRRRARARRERRKESETRERAKAREIGKRGHWLFVARSTYGNRYGPTTLPLECVLFSFLCLPHIPGGPLSLRIAAVAAAVNLLWAILVSNRQPEEDQVRSKEKERGRASKRERERERGTNCISKRGGKNGRRVGRREKLRSIVERRKEHEGRLG